jgi:HAD superfamily hydrolase (TIGR01490 family)
MSVMRSSTTKVATRTSAKRKVAIFDIDGTVFRSSLLIEVTEGLIQKKLFPESARERYAKARQAWMDRKGSYDDYIMAVVAAFGEHLPGIHYQDFLDVAEEVVRSHKDRVYRYTRDMVLDLKQRGYFLLAISLSPKSVVEKFAKQLGFDKVYGLLYKQDAEGRYEHGLESADIIADKGKILLRAVEKENLSLRGSVGVGDTEGDIKFLKLVEKPICFNPNSLLFAHAKRAGWKVVVERKDVIYKLVNR